MRATGTAQATSARKTRVGSGLLTLAVGLVLPALVGAQTGGGPATRPAATRAATQPATRSATPGGAWSMPDYSDLVERALRRIVTQDKPGSLPINGFKQRAIGRAETIAAVRRYLGRDVDLSASAFASVAEWTDARAMEPAPVCAEADSTCAPPSTVWLALVKFERGDLPHELNVWYTTSFSAKPHDQVITNKYSFCERWLRVGGVWKYDGFIRVTSG